jgi:hypothetical protein
VHEEGDMTELQRADAIDRLVETQSAPVGENLELGAFRILEGQQLGRAWNGIAAQLAFHPVRGKPTSHIAEVLIGSDFERQLGAARDVAAH